MLLDYLSARPSCIRGSDSRSKDLINWITAFTHVAVSHFYGDVWQGTQITATGNQLVNSSSVKLNFIKNTTNGAAFMDGVTPRKPRGTWYLAIFATLVLGSSGCSGVPIPASITMQPASQTI